MPAHHGRRLHEHEGVAPGRPAPTQSDPQEAIDGTEPRAVIAAGEQFQLMPSQALASVMATGRAQFRTTTGQTSGGCDRRILSRFSSGAKKAVMGTFLINALPR